MAKYILVINQDKDLKVLEKYGFEKMFGYCKYYNKQCTTAIHINKINNEVICDFKNDNSKYDLLNDLYDLIQAGIIKKVEE